MATQEDEQTLPAQTGTAVPKPTPPRRPPPGPTDAAPPLGYDEGVMPPWVPNAISVLRILLVPVCLLLAEATQEAARTGGPVTDPRTQTLACLAAIGISDLLDGFLARRYGLATTLGATLDAVADKLAQVGLLLYFTVSSGPAFAALPAWFFAVVLGRDLVLAAGWSCVRKRRGRVEVVHHWHGKAASVLIFALLVWVTGDFGRVVLGPALTVISVLIALSTAHYCWFGWTQFRERTLVA